MLNERDTDLVEIEVLSISPPRVRVRGLPGAAAEAVRTLLDGQATLVLEGDQDPPEVHASTDVQIPSPNTIIQWLRTRKGAPYNLIDLVSQLTKETPEAVRERFYVRAGRDQRRVGSDYRATCLTRHRTCARELEQEGWQLIEQRFHKRPTQFRLVPPEAQDAA